MKIFISYAREDESVARRLHTSLSVIPGVLPWLDRDNLLPGDDWQEAITQAMEDSRLVILLLSTNSVDKEGFVQKEVREALKLFENKPPGRSFLIPARIEYCVPRFRQLHQLQWVDLFDGWDESMNKIQAVIEREQRRDMEIARVVDKAQQKKNHEDAKLVVEKLSVGLRENLKLYAEWLWSHEYSLHPYTQARQSIPNWTKQAKPEWLSELNALGALDSVDVENARFTNVGLEMLYLL